MVTSDQLARSKSIQRRTGRTFHIATRCLPKHIRHATYVLYAFFRKADEVVDDPDPAPPDVQRATLATFRRAAVGTEPTDDPVLAAFAEVRERHGIADREIHAFLDAMERDVADADGHPVAFEDTAALTGYLRGSAVAVAYMMLAIMDPADPGLARPHARALGEAFQLTNFLRDVREDAVEYGRVYLPRSTLDLTGAEPEDVLALRPTDEVRAAIAYELERAESRYRSGVAGIQYLPRGCQFPVLMAATFYAEYHRIVRARSFDVLSTPPSLSPARYASLFLRVRWHWYRGRSPSETFHRVSPIPRASGDAPAAGSGFSGIPEDRSEPGI